MTKCSIIGCTRKMVAKSFCLMHYKRKWRHGDPLKRLRRANGEGGETMGYRTITVGGRAVFEHRYLMEQKLGRSLQPGEQVHHADGNQKNNAIENLVLTKIGEHQAMHRKYRATETDKECGKCRQFLPRSQFGRVYGRSKYADPNTVWCLICNRAACAAYRAKLKHLAKC